jgi:hypothetical protein
MHLDHSNCNAELYRGVPFRLWDFCGDRRRIAELWGFCGVAERTRTTRPALPTLTVAPTAVVILTDRDESRRPRTARSPTMNRE